MTTTDGKLAVILMAEDDPDDRMLSEEALQEAHVVNDLRFVPDGEELIDYLCMRGKYTSPEKAPRPSLILLDLNMPRKDGREALVEGRADAVLAASIFHYREHRIEEVKQFLEKSGLTMRKISPGE